MAEFTCKCGGKIIWLATNRYVFQIPKTEVSFYGCEKCHLVYFDTPQDPLTQDHIDSVRAFEYKLRANELEIRIVQDNST